MKKYLLPEKGKFYKANMHMHTNVSDGRLSPQEVKEAYMEKGYSIVAYTDHEILLPHTELTDENFVAITAAELAFNLYHTEGGYPFIKTYHLNFYSKDPNKSVLPIWDPDLVFESVKPKISAAQKACVYKREYGVEAVNKAIEIAKADGFFVSYNHPVWSLQDYSDYGELKGVWGVECYNHGSMLCGLPDEERPFNDLLVQGERVFPLATDDAHDRTQFFGGFVMVKAEKLDYTTVINALERGDFYASTAPEIHELTIEDGIVRIRCSSVREIRLTTERRWAIRTAKQNAPLTEADFDLHWYLEQTKNTKKWRDAFFRITLVDEQGNFAYTRAYFVDELQ